MKIFIAFVLCAIIFLGNRGQAEELKTFRLEIKDGVLNPIEIKVPAGQRFKIEIFNIGTSPIEFESIELRKEKVLGPGASSFVVIHALKPGQYKFFDEFHMDIGQGLIIAE
ncbi:MAG: cupredoxin domain-containing protein [Alphaproteobacteria bacterium]|nr:cupredoxin domain-containing protein [Alphaproteobacteria bacterium]